jgi:Uma2 family endonuclease
VFYYPDVVVGCLASYHEPYYTETPLLVAEVLFDSTNAVDERAKRLAYQAIETLREYVSWINIAGGAPVPA